jgi:hypothetical protein
MKGQLMHFTIKLHFGPMRAEKMVLPRIYTRVSYILLKTYYTTFVRMPARFYLE